MKALQLQQVGKLELVDIDPPAPADDQLLVRTGAAVICTSDLNDIRENPFNIALPVIMGHEAAGTVVIVGKDVKGFRPGDRVTTHPVHPCGRCANCRSGVAHLCSDMGHFGLNMQGTFAECFVVRSDRARKVPTDMPFDQAALAEPVCVCLEALSQARLKTRDRPHFSPQRVGSVPSFSNLLILGDGPFGALTACLAGAMGLGKVVVAGHHDFRLAFAKGATGINSHKTADLAGALKQAVNGEGYDAAILCVGRAEAAHMGLALLKPKGRLVIFSALPGQTPIDLFSVHVRELEIVGACNDDDRLDEAVARLSDPALELGRLVTHRFPLDQYRRAFEIAAGGHEQAMKVAITFDA
jgi:threonine dehydrogenase-like Zn-dependent dehydrogenase